MSGDYSKLSDEELVSRFSETRVDDCFSEIVRRFQHKVRAGAYAVLRDRSLAQDVSQDSFVRLLMNSHSFRGGSFASWLQTVTRNLSLNLLKRSLREKPSEGMCCK